MDKFYYLEILEDVQYRSPHCLLSFAGPFDSAQEARDSAGDFPNGDFFNLIEGDCNTHSIRRIEFWSWTYTKWMRYEGNIP
jgi:hypothetical protein